MAPKTVEMMCKKLPQLWLVLQYLRNVETLKFKVNGIAIDFSSISALISFIPELITSYLNV